MCTVIWTGAHIVGMLLFFQQLSAALSLPPFLGKRLGHGLNNLCARSSGRFRLCTPSTILALNGISFMNNADSIRCSLTTRMCKL